MNEAFDPYHRWLGIHPKHQPPDLYRLLGAELFEDDPEVIADAAERQMAHVRRYAAGEHGDLSQKILNELAAAKACLLDVTRKAAYDRELYEQLDAARSLVQSGPASGSLVSPQADIAAESDTIVIRAEERYRQRRGRPRGQRRPAHYARRSGQPVAMPTREWGLPVAIGLGTLLLLVVVLLSGFVFRSVAVSVAIGVGVGIILLAYVWSIKSFQQTSRRSAHSKRPAGGSQGRPDAPSFEPAQQEVAGGLPDGTLPVPSAPAPAAASSDDIDDNQDLICGDYQDKEEQTWTVDEQEFPALEEADDTPPVTIPPDGSPTAHDETSPDSVGTDAFALGPAMEAKNLVGEPGEPSTVGTEAQTATPSDDNEGDSLSVVPVLPETRAEPVTRHHASNTKRIWTPSTPVCTAVCSGLLMLAVGIALAITGLSIGGALAVFGLLLTISGLIVWWLNSRVDDEPTGTEPATPAPERELRENLKEEKEDAIVAAFMITLGIAMAIPVLIAAFPSIKTAILVVGGVAITLVVLFAFKGSKAPETASPSHTTEHEAEKTLKQELVEWIIAIGVVIGIIFVVVLVGLTAKYWPR